MPKTKEKHIERLIQGKKSGVHIGSRSTPHHLYAYEKKKFDAAIKKRFLLIDERDRVNLQNVWEKYCSAKEWPYVVLIKDRKGGAGIYSDQLLIFSGTLQEAKVRIKDIV